MVDYTNYTQTQSVAGAGIDTGLRSHMLKVYNHMAAGLVLSGAISYLIVKNPALVNMVISLQWVLLAAMLGMVFLVLPRMMSMSEGGAKLSFYSYALLMGVSFAPMFLVYTGESIARAFFMSAVVFMSMSLYGYTTKKDLTSWGTFLIIGVWGVFIAALVNLFLQSSMVSFVSSVVAVILAVGLTAYDTQKIKQYYFVFGSNKEMVSKSAIMGALQLYFDFIYLFVNLLRILGDRR